MNPASSTTGAAGREEFLTLLVAQLQHQDPLEPVPQHEFLAQLAQFSTLEGVEETNSNLESLNGNFATLLEMEQVNQGADIIGKHITYFDGEGNKISSTEPVSAVQLEHGELRLVTGSDSVPMSKVVGVASAS